jgi:serine/threonine-protein kinase
MSDPLARFPELLCERYRPEAMLGAGGMGVVFRALDTELSRRVAVKISLMIDDPMARERFHREAQALSALRHPSVLEIFEWGVAPEGAYLITEYLEGETYRVWAERRREDPEGPGPETLLEPMLAVGEALEAVHAAGMLHRDLKPENIFMTAQGAPKLLDFGLVMMPERTRLTHSQQIVGTLAFLPPEALRGEPLQAAADWYGWGATLFAAHEGRPPYTPEQLLLFLHGGELPPPRFECLDPGSPAGRVVAANLRVDPTWRLQGLAAIRRGLEDPSGLAAPESGETTALDSSGPHGAPGRRRPRRIPPLALLACGLLVAGGLHLAGRPGGGARQDPAAGAPPPPSSFEEVLALLERDLEALQVQAPAAPDRDPARWLGLDLPGVRALVRWERTDGAFAPPEAVPDTRLEELDGRFHELGLPRPLVGLRARPPRGGEISVPEVLKGAVGGEHESWRFSGHAASALLAFEASELQRQEAIAQLEDYRRTGVPPRGVPSELARFLSYGLTNLNESVQAAHMEPEGRRATLRWLRRGSSFFRQGLRSALWAIRTRPEEEGNRLAVAVVEVIDRQEAYAYGEVAYLDPWDRIDEASARPGEHLVVAALAREVAEARRFGRRPWEPLLRRGVEGLRGVLRERSPPGRLRIEVAQLMLICLTRLGDGGEAVRLLDAEVARLVETREGREAVAEATETFWEEVRAEPARYEAILAACGDEVLRSSRSKRRYPRLRAAVLERRGR